jgi:hypothetical protein
VRAEGRVRAPLPKVARGKRPRFHEADSIDRLVSIVLALTSEVSVLRDRLDTVETLGSRAGWLPPGAVDAYVPNLEERQAREARREAYLGRVLAILKSEVAELDGGANEGGYWATIEAIERGEV